MYRFLQYFDRADREWVGLNCTPSMSFADLVPHSPYGPHGTWRDRRRGLSNCPLAMLLTRVGIHTIGSPGPESLAHTIWQYVRLRGGPLTSVEVANEVRRFVHDVDLGKVPDLVIYMTADPPPASRRPPYDVVADAEHIAKNAFTLTNFVDGELLPLAKPTNVLTVQTVVEGVWGPELAQVQ